MAVSTYAVVAYIDGELARFVAEFRARLSPADSHLQPHITILPPRRSSVAETKIISMVRSRCTVPRFAVEAVEVTSFQPVTPTIYLSLSPAEPIQSLNHRLASLPLGTSEEWAFIPHLTLARLADPAHAASAIERAQAAWSAYRGPRRINVGALTLVAESTPNHWADVISWNLPV